MFEVDGALTDAEQFVWGGAEATPTAELVASLRRARRWASRVSAATKTKPTMELLRPLLAVDPPPMQHPGALPPRAYGLSVTFGSLVIATSACSCLIHAAQVPMTQLACNVGCWRRAEHCSLLPLAQAHPPSCPSGLDALIYQLLEGPCDMIDPQLGPDDGGCSQGCPSCGTRAGRRRRG